MSKVHKRTLYFIDKLKSNKKRRYVIKKIINNILILALCTILVLGIYFFFAPQINNIASHAVQRTRKIAHSTRNPKNTYPTVTGQYDGMTYKDNEDGKIIFTDGTMQRKNNAISLFVNAPKNIREANDVSFQNVDTSQINNMRGLFSNDSHLKKLDLGHYFNVKQVSINNWSNGFSNMFSNDTNLTTLNLGSKFDKVSLENSNPHGYTNMFHHDTKLSFISPQTHALPYVIQQALSYRNNQFY